MVSIAPAGSFSGRTVIITGAGGTIGRALSFAFARAGANVLVNELGGNADGTCSDPKVGEALAAEIRDLGFIAVANGSSVTDAGRIVHAALEAFGRIDIVVNNAGIIHHAPMEQQDAASMQAIFNVNALGAMSLLHHVWPIFQQQRYGRVVNFTSGSIFGMPNSASYVLSRAATMGITRTLALEGAPYNITVNAVGPSSYSRMVAGVMDNVPPPQLDAFKQTYTGESNCPLILALAHESNTTTGEILSTGGYTISRLILGVSSPISDCKTMEDAQKALPEVLDQGRKWTEPKSITDYLAFQTSCASEE